MDIALESLEGLQRQLRITLSASTLEQRLDARLAEVAVQSKIPGFRPGKAPLSVLRQRYGQELREEVIEELLKEAFAHAQAEHQLRIAGEIQVEAASALAGLPSYTYVLHFEVFPEIPDLDLSKISLSVPQVQVEEQDIDESLAELQEEEAEWRPAKRDSKEDDIIFFEYQIFDHGKLLDSGQKANFILGDDRFFTDSLSKALLGMRAKESKVLDVIFPAELSVTYPTLAGKALRLHLTMQQVLMAQLPPLDAALAAKMGYTDLEALREATCQQLEREATFVVSEYVDAQLFAALDALVDFPLPMVLVAQQMQTIFERQSKRKTELLRDLPREEAEVFFTPAYNQVKERLLLEKLGEQLQVVFDQKTFQASLPALFPPDFDVARMKEILEDKDTVAMFAEAFYLRQVRQAVLAQVNKETPTLSFGQFMADAPNADRPVLAAPTDSPLFPQEPSNTTGDENDKNV